MRTTNRWLLTVLACALVFSVLAVIKYTQIQAAIAFGESFPEPSESVEAMVVSVGTLERSYSTIGEILAPRWVEMRNEIEGRIAAVNFDSGDRVARGDVLVQLDVREESARLQAARARAELAGLELDRLQRLLKQKSVSEEAVDQAAASRDVALAEVMALEAAIDKKTLRAPFDAVVGIHSLNEGEFLQSNTPIVTLVGITDHVWVDFNVPLEHGSIPLDTRVDVTLPGADGEVLPATVIARNVMASASSRNIRLRARIDQLLPLPANTVVEVEVPLGGVEQILVPRTALLVDSRGDYVYVVEEDGAGYRARRRAVEVGYRDDELATVVSGLEVGELIAIHGAFKLRPGMLTHVRERPDLSGSEGG